MWSFPRCVSHKGWSLGLGALRKEGEKKQEGGAVWEPGEGNLEKELVVTIRATILALRKPKRLTEEKPGEGECGDFGRSPRPEVKTGMILDLGV